MASGEFLNDASSRDRLLRSAIAVLLEVLAVILPISADFLALTCRSVYTVAESRIAAMFAPTPAVGASLDGRFAPSLVGMVAAIILGDFGPIW